MAPDETVDPAERSGGKEEDPVLKTVVDRDLNGHMRFMLAYARERSEDPFWPVGLCVAWVLRPDCAEAIELYARHRVGLGIREVEGWREAQTALLRALAAGRIEASGVRPQDGQRIPVPAQDWIDLSIVQRGQYDEVRRRLDGSIAYRDVRIPAADIRQEWRPETPAAKTIRERNAVARACLSALIQRMRDNPNHPLPKRVLLPQFPGVSHRMFERLYSQAVRESGCVAWSKGGRRPNIRGIA